MKRIQVALALAIIRSKPPGLTVVEYAGSIQAQVRLKYASTQVSLLKCFNLINLIWNTVIQSVPPSFGPTASKLMHPPPNEQIPLKPEVNVPAQDKLAVCAELVVH